MDVEVPTATAEQASGGSGYVLDGCLASPQRQRQDDPDGRCDTRGAGRQREPTHPEGGIGCFCKLEVGRERAGRRTSQGQGPATAIVRLK